MTSALFKKGAHFRSFLKPGNGLQSTWDDYHSALYEARVEIYRQWRHIPDFMKNELKDRFARTILDAVYSTLSEIMQSLINPYEITPKRFNQLLIEKLRVELGALYEEKMNEQMIQRRSNAMKALNR